MANYIGGSAPAMASQVAEGMVLLGANALRTFTPAELNLLRQEIERLQREARAVVPPADDALAQQARNRKIGRLGSALQVIGHQLTGRR
ncbi:MAG TPA: hypothetical protein VMT87_03425 [Vicinamibacteria bacterium]|nr:hypothetical protein [Vicinamibacteria bacterium]